jgi:hypothetical protein
MKRVLAIGMAALVLGGTMGGGCDIVIPVDDDDEDVIIVPPPVVLPPVTVELVNATSNPVTPFLWADPATLFFPEEVMIPENFIDIGPPLNAGDVATITLTCADAGTLLTDADLLLAPSGTLPSENLLLLNEGTHYLCGDVVSFYFEVDGAGGFFTTVDVNGVTIPF